MPNKQFIGTDLNEIKNQFIDHTYLCDDYEFDFDPFSIKLINVRFSKRFYIRNVNNIEYLGCYYWDDEFIPASKDDLAVPDRTVGFVFYIDQGHMTVTCFTNLEWWVLVNQSPHNIGCFIPYHNEHNEKEKGIVFHITKMERDMMREILQKLGFHL
jgi:hypothetical protein